MSYLSYSGSFSSVSGIPSGYTLQYNPTELDLVVRGNNSVLGASASSVSLGRVMLNYVPATNVTISLTSGTSRPVSALQPAAGPRPRPATTVPGPSLFGIGIGQRGPDQCHGFL